MEQKNWLSKKGNNLFFLKVLSEDNFSGDHPNLVLASKRVSSLALTVALKHQQDWEKGAFLVLESCEG